MTSPEKMNAPVAAGAFGVRNQFQVQEKEVTMTNIIAQDAQNVEFDAAHYIDARFAGNLIIDVQHEDWIGEQLVRVETPGTVLHLRTHEARDLAAALQNIATHLDESGVTC